MQRRAVYALLISAAIVATGATVAVTIGVARAPQKPVISAGDQSCLDSAATYVGAGFDGKILDHHRMPYGGVRVTGTYTGGRFSCFLTYDTKSVDQLQMIPDFGQPLTLYPSGASGTVLTLIPVTFPQNSIVDLSKVAHTSPQGLDGPPPYTNPLDY